MTRTIDSRSQYPAAFAGMLACLASFGVTFSFYLAVIGRIDYLWRTDWIPGLLAPAFACYLAAASFEHPSNDGFRRWLDQFLYTAGLSFIAEYGLVYMVRIKPIPLSALVAGVGLSTASALWVTRALPRMRRQHSGVLLVGFDSIARALVSSLGQRIVGVLDADAGRVPADLRLLGTPGQLAEAVATTHPGRIIVSGRTSLSQIPPRLLLNLRYSGITIDAAASVYQSAFSRVCWARMRPFDLLFPASTHGNAVVVMVQSIYTNLIGLALLLLLLPLLVAIMALIALTSGGEPVLQQIEYLGFERTPFERFRFRTCGRDGRLTRIGSALTRLHLVALPQLLNVVRGEMALFGPPPVRKEFADRLSQLIPVYARRFMVKPGLLSWSRVNLSPSNTMPDEVSRLEYEIYYAEEGSVSLDLEILIRSIWRAFFASGSRGTPRASSESS